LTPEEGDPALLLGFTNIDSMQTAQTLGKRILRLLEPGSHSAA
jgi:hypothetical protein